jgi:hypothetical protein
VFNQLQAKHQDILKAMKGGKGWRNLLSGKASNADEMDVEWLNSWFCMYTERRSAMWAIFVAIWMIILKICLYI